MSVGRRSLALLAAALLAGCAAAHPPLATITRIPGSTTREGNVIEPLDSAHRIHRVNGATSTAGTIRPLHDSTGAGSATAGTIRPLHDPSGTEPSTAGVIRPLEGRRPAASPADTAVVPLDGTRWAGTTVDGPITFEFLVGGILRYTTETGVYTNGTWQQLGNTLQFEMNGHYADYTGRIRGGRMSGTAHNTPGRSWEWEATRE